MVQIIWLTLVSVYVVLRGGREGGYNSRYVILERPLCRQRRSWARRLLLRPRDNDARAWGMVGTTKLGYSVITINIFFIFQILSNGN